MKLRTCAFLIGCLIHGGVYAACRDIVVLSQDARYMVLDSTTLEVRDVGNLWWLGIRQLGRVVDGSTIDEFWISPNIFVDPSTYEELNVELGEDGYYRSTVDRYFLENLGRNYRTQAEIPFINFEEEGISPAWASYLSTKIARSQDETYRFILSGHRFDNVENNRFAVLNPSFAVVVNGTVSSSADSAVCQFGDHFHVAGGREAWSFDRLSGEVSYADWPDQQYVILRMQDGCRVLTRPRGDAVNPDYDWRLIDISTGETLSRFDLDVIPGRSLLFDYGRHWLIQKGRSENNVSIATPEFILVDTVNGEILAQTVLDIGEAEIPQAYLSRRFCDSGDNEQRVVALDNPLAEDEPTTLYLIDARTLSILNSTTLPFNERVWAF